MFAANAWNELLSNPVVFDRDDGRRREKDRAAFIIIIIIIALCYEGERDDSFCSTKLLLWFPFLRCMLRQFCSFLITLYSQQNSNANEFLLSIAWRWIESCNSKNRCFILPCFRSVLARDKKQECTVILNLILSVFYLKSRNLTTFCRNISDVKESIRIIHSAQPRTQDNKVQYAISYRYTKKVKQREYYKVFIIY